MFANLHASYISIDFHVQVVFSFLNIELHDDDLKERNGLTEYSVNGMISSRIISRTSLIRGATKKSRDTGN